MKRTLCFRTIFAVLVIGIMATVFFFSSQSGGESNHLSQGVLEHILGFFQIHVDPMKLDQYNLVLRKIAHFSLYFLLGAGAMGFCLPPRSRKNIALCSPLCSVCSLQPPTSIISSCWVHVTEMLWMFCWTRWGRWWEWVWLALGKEFANKLEL